MLVHAAAGGVGTMAVQLARLRGANVVGTASAANHEFLRELGAEPVAYGEGLVTRVEKAAPAGVDAVIDLVGGEALELSFALVADPARVVSIVDATTVLGHGGRYVFVRPDRGHAHRAVPPRRRGGPAGGRRRHLPARARRRGPCRVEAGHVRGKIVLEVALRVPARRLGRLAAQLHRG